MTKSLDTLADKIDYLFRNTKKPDGNYYTYEEVAASSPNLSVANLSALRTGRKSNPSLKVIQALIEFFNIDDSNFFFDTGEGMTSYDEKIKTLATRASELDETGLDFLLDVIEQIKG